MQRRNDYDVTNSVKTTDPDSVNAAVGGIFAGLYPAASRHALDRAFKDLASLHHGEYPGYRASDTTYHNLQHTLDVTLAMARLMDGYERTPERAEALGPVLFSLGVITALFHDIGYLRRETDTRHKNGAEYTFKHVSRGARFLGDYLDTVGMAKLASVAGRIVHFTGYERPINTIKLPKPIHRTLGNLLASADILAQMSDRCYLEKCRDRLFQEFVEGGLAARDESDQRASVKYASAQELVVKTPSFFTTAMDRLENQLGGVYRFAQTHFKGRNLYIEAIKLNIQFAAELGKLRDISLLRRLPPPTGAVGTDSA